MEIKEFEEKLFMVFGDALQYVRIAKNGMEVKIEGIRQNSKGQNPWEFYPLSDVGVKKAIENIRKFLNFR